ncbi:hypothetical protein [Acanthopleuribacter pedis]|uniref:Uncharacterized protein n=1 Tax=Acanthopleuribacter pedis TaxID=442870 RepID=A0A8J7QLP9_9BACT|nr:hypothetical protein [Acanthopleuribacter pedis]MBO1323486.1 hypothetical protein [Acanthopleuribacter pedis]
MNKHSLGAIVLKNGIFEKNINCYLSVNKTSFEKKHNKSKTSNESDPINLPIVFNSSFPYNVMPEYWWRKMHGVIEQPAEKKKEESLLLYNSNHGSWERFSLTFFMESIYVKLPFSKELQQFHFHCLLEENISFSDSPIIGSKFFQEDVYEEANFQSLTYQLGWAKDKKKKDQNWFQRLF